MLNAIPVRAYSTSSRRFRKDIGDIHDHFHLVYEYTSCITSNHTCIQVDGV